MKAIGRDQAFCLLATALLLGGLTPGGDRAADYRGLRSAAMFSRAQDDAGVYVPARMHNPFARRVPPAAPARDGGDVALEPRGWRVRGNKPIVVASPAAAATGEEDERETRQGQRSSRQLDVGDEATDPMSVALENWGWLSREVLRAKWVAGKREEQTPAQALFEDQFLKDPAWIASPWQADLQGFRGGSAETFSDFGDMGDGDRAWGMPGAGYSTFLFSPGQTEEPEADPYRSLWQPSESSGKRQRLIPEFETSEGGYSPPASTRDTADGSFNPALPRF